MFRRHESRIGCTRKCSEVKRSTVSAMRVESHTLTNTTLSDLVRFTGRDTCAVWTYCWHNIPCKNICARVWSLQRRPRWWRYMNYHLILKRSGEFMRRLTVGLSKDKQTALAVNLFVVTHNWPCLNKNPLASVTELKITGFQSRRRL